MRGFLGANSLDRPSRPLWLLIGVALVAVVSLCAVGALALQHHDSTRRGGKPAAARAPATRVEEVTLPYINLKNDLFTTQYMAKYQGPDRYQNLVEQLTLQRLYNADPTNFSPVAAERQILALRALVNADRTSAADQFAAHPLGLSDTADGLLNVLKAIPGGSESGKFSLGFIDAAAQAARLAGKDALQEGADSTTYLTLNDQANQYAQTGQQAQGILTNSLGLATDPKFAAAFNGLYSARMDCTTGCSPDQLLASSSDLRNLDATRWMIDQATGKIRDDIKTSTGGIRLDIQKLQDTEAKQFGDLQHSVDAARSDIQELTQAQYEGNATLLDFVDRYNRDQAYRQKQEDDAAKRQAAAANRATNLAGAQSSVYLLSKLTGAIDPVLGKDVFTVGNSLIQIGDNVNSLVSILSSAAQATVNPLALVSVAANIVSAILPIADLFGPSSPTPDEVIIQQVQQMQREIGALRDEMNSRFDRIDQGLNTIFNALVTNFDKIDAKLGTIEDGVRTLQTALWNLQLSVDTLEGHMHQVAEDQSRRDLWPTLDEALNWNKIQRSVDMPATKFADFNAFFYAYATTDAYDTVASPPFTEPSSYGDVLTQLRKYPIEENVNYVGVAAKKLVGVDIFNSTKLPNPRDWSLGSRAYEQLALDWPDLAKRSDPSRFNAIAEPGKQLDRAFGRISRTPALFGRLVSDYKSNVQALQTTLDDEERTYLATAVNAAPRVVFGPADQQLPDASLITITAIPTCSGAAALNAPDDLRQRLIPNQFSVARALNVGNLQVCYTANWINETTDAEDTTHAQLQLTVHGQYQPATDTSSWQDFRTMSVTSPERVECQWVDQPDHHGGTHTVRVCDGAYTTALNWWHSGLSTSFDQRALTVDSVGAVDAVTTEVRKAQSTDAHKLYTDVEHHLGRAEDPLQKEAREVGGVKALLEAFIQLGLPETAGTDELILSATKGPVPLDDDLTLLADVKSADAALPLKGSSAVGPDVLEGRQTRDDALASEVLRRVKAFDTAGAKIADHQPLIIRSLRRVAAASTITYWAFAQAVRLSRLRITPAILSLHNSGTAISYLATQASPATLVVLREYPQDKWKKVTTILLHDRIGSNRSYFSGVVGGRRLQPGRYAIKISAIISTGARSNELSGILQIKTK